MSRYDGRILNLLDPLWRQRKVDLITFPCPPVPVKGTFYAADAWRSDTLERAEPFFGDCIASAFTNRGPAFLLRRELGKVLVPSAVSDEPWGIYKPDPIYCSSTSYKNLFSAGSLDYATDAVLERVQAIQNSCHQASHTVAPAAPFLSLLLLLDRDYKDVGDFMFADEERSQRYFPEHDFSENARLDKMFRYLTVSQALGQEVKTVRIPRHIAPKLAQRVVTTMVSNENIANMYPSDYGRLMRIADLRDAPKENENASV